MLRWRGAIIALRMTAVLRGRFGVDGYVRDTVASVTKLVLGPEGLHLSGAIARI